MGPQNTAKVSNVSTFQQPIHALLNGNPVRLIAIGDQEGKSPVYLGVGADGRSYWESTGQFVIIDTNVLPLSLDALQQMNNQGRSSSSGSTERTQR